MSTGDTCPSCGRQYGYTHPSPWWFIPSPTQQCCHCYCQPAEPVGGVPHQRCCKCGDTRAIGTWQSGTIGNQPKEE